MGIDIFGDVIYYQGRPVGCITVPNGTLRGAFEEWLERATVLNKFDEQLRTIKSTLDEII